MQLPPGGEAALLQLYTYKLEGFRLLKRRRIPVHIFRCICGLRMGSMCCPHPPPPLISDGEEKKKFSTGTSQEPHHRSVSCTVQRHEIAPRCRGPVCPGAGHRPQAGLGGRRWWHGGRGGCPGTPLGVLLLVQARVRL